MCRVDSEVELTVDEKVPQFCVGRARPPDEPR